MSNPAPPAAPEVDERVPWGILDCVGVLVVTFVAVVVAVNVLALAIALADLPEELLLVQLPLPLALLGVVTVMWVHRRHRAAGALTGPRRAGAGAWLHGIGWGVGAFVALNVVVSLLVQLLAATMGFDLPDTQEGMREAASDPQRVPWLAFTAVIVAPLAEEVYFRGMLYPALRRSIGRWGGILASAALFAAAHLLTEGTLGGGALVFVLIMPLGVFLAWLYDRRGNLAAPIAVHMVFNAVTLAVMLAATGLLDP